MTIGVKIYRHPEFISGSCDDSGISFEPSLSENLKQVQIDDRYQRVTITQICSQVTS